MRNGGKDREGVWVEGELVRKSNGIDRAVEAISGGLSEGQRG